MTTVTHAFVSGKSDGGDATLVRPSDWNTGHTVTGEAMVMLDDKPLGSDTASFDFTSISGSYKHLMLVISGRSTKASTTNDFCTMKFNNDGGSNYDDEWVQVFGVTTVLAAEDVAAASFAHALLVPAADSATGASMSGEIWIPDYASTTLQKSWHSDHYAPVDHSTGNLRRCYSGGNWRSTAAITRITIAPSGGNWKTGSRATLYGLN